jgi:uncharacterized membrane protein YcjF (UPF0283 family)
MSHSAPIDAKPKRLVDMEFKPGELPPAQSAPAVLDPSLEGTVENRRQLGMASWMALTSATLVFLMIVFGSAISFASRAFREGSVIDIIFLIALISLVTSICVLVGRQAQAYAKLKSAERARELAAHLSKVGGAGSGKRLVDILGQLYVRNDVILSQLDTVSQSLQAHHSDRDVIELLNRDVFSGMDQRADDRIQRAALRASIGVSTCPHPALDALVVMGISLSLIKDLMSIYGLRHSARALYRIFTRILLTASSTAVMSTAVEFLVKAAQDRIAGAVIGTAGEALIVARRMFALGTLAKREIRPLPMPD